MNEIDRDALIMEWQDAVATLAKAKEEEAKLRKQICEEVFQVGENELREGTENIDLGRGYKIKSVFKITRGFIGGETAVRAALEEIKSGSDEGEFIAERIIRWKPELSVSEYKKLPPRIEGIINKILTSKPAMPSLEVVAPKAKK